MHKISKDPRYSDAVLTIKTYVLGVFDSTCVHYDKTSMAQALSPERFKMMEAAALRAGEFAMREYTKIRRGYVEAKWRRGSRASKGAKNAKHGMRLSHPKH